MAQRRMFSPQIIDSDAFLDMSTGAQSLYFHLGMRADDDGFVSNPKKILRIIGSNEDDLKVLIVKRFILTFESGVIVIKHWLIHNLIRVDLYHETQYKKEKSLLGLNENGAYTELREGIPEIKKIEPPEWLKRRKGTLQTENVPKSACKDRIGKDRIGEYNNSVPSTPKIEESEELKEFKPLKENLKWQLEALEAIKFLSATKKSSIFKCYKDNSPKARFALNDCKELGKLNELYFLKVYNELIKK